VALIGTFKLRRHIDQDNKRPVILSGEAGNKFKAQHPEEEENH